MEKTAPRNPYVQINNDYSRNLNNPSLSWKYLQDKNTSIAAKSLATASLVGSTLAGGYVGGKIGVQVGMPGGPPGMTLGGTIGTVAGCAFGFYTGYRALHVAVRELPSFEAWRLNAIQKKINNEIDNQLQKDNELSGVLDSVTLEIINYPVKWTSPTTRHTWHFEAQTIQRLDRDVDGLITHPETREKFDPSTLVPDFVKGMHIQKRKVELCTKDLNDSQTPLAAKEKLVDAKMVAQLMFGEFKDQALAEIDALYEAPDSTMTKAEWVQKKNAIRLITI